MKLPWRFWHQFRMLRDRGSLNHSNCTRGMSLMDHAEDRRWTARRKFWFPSGILVDRRASVERRAGSDRRQSRPTPMPPSLTDDRRLADDRRDADHRRSGERRIGPRRPSDHAQGEAGHGRLLLVPFSCACKKMNMSLRANLNAYVLSEPATKG